MAYIHFEQNNFYTKPFLESQTKQLLACAEDKHWEIIHFYTDTGPVVSCQKRSGFLSMRKIMDTQNISLILTPAVRHIARSTFPMPAASAPYYFYAVKEQMLLPLYPDTLF